MTTSETIKGTFHPLCRVLCRNRLSPLTITFLLLTSLLPVLFGCTKVEGPTPDQIAAHAAKVYYEQLLHGDYNSFVDGRYQPTKMPQSYHEQLVANAKMFISQQNKEHKGIKKVEVSDARADTTRHVANAFLTLTYGDSSKEEIVVPMVEKKGVWYMR